MNKYANSSFTNSIKSIIIIVPYESFFSLAYNS